MRFNINNVNKNFQWETKNDRVLCESKVDHPPHYNNGGIECIDAIKASMTEEEYKGFLKGNVMKYLWRYELKENPKQDLKKAQWYLDKLLKEI